MVTLVYMKMMEHYTKEAIGGMGVNNVAHSTSATNGKEKDEIDKPDKTMLKKEQG